MAYHHGIVVCKLGAVLGADEEEMNQADFVGCFSFLSLGENKVEAVGDGWEEVTSLRG